MDDERWIFNLDFIFCSFVQNVHSQVFGGKDKDAILFLYSHSSRINPAALLIMRLYKIHISTHIIQPFDNLLWLFLRENIERFNHPSTMMWAISLYSAYRAFKKSFTSGAIINAFAVTGLQPVQVARCLNDKHTHRNFDDLEFTSRTSKSNRLHTSALLTSNKILSKIIKDANDTGVWNANQAEVKTLRNDISIKNIWPRMF